MDKQARSRPAARAVRPLRRPASTAATKNRAEKSAERRSAIISAALQEFCAKGYAAARLDDVAQRAGVAKGTIYLHFRDKEALFQEIVRTMLVPMISVMEEPPQPGVTIRALMQKRIELFVREVYATERRDVLRLVLAEGPRFPELAEFHYRTVVGRAMAAMRALLELAAARGELRHADLVSFPQLVVAPLLLSVIWSGMFERFAPLDVAGLMRTHLDILFGKEGAP